MKVDVGAIESQFWPYGSNRDVYMVLDGARDRRIYSDLMNSHLIYSCLYSGDLAYEIEVAAPHLVQLEYEDKSTRSLIQRAWGNSWGIYLKSDDRKAFPPSSPNVSNGQELARGEAPVSVLRPANLARLSTHMHDL